MISFDVSKEWTILIPPGVSVAKKVGEDLSHYIDLLRRQTGLPPKPLPIQDTSLKHGAVSYIHLNADKDTREKNGFSWRLVKESLEIYGESDRGLWNGFFDFLMALGFSWPEPEQELLPPINTLKPQEYTLKENYAYHPSSSDTIRRRLLFGREDPSKKWKSLILWAARNKIDTLVFSLQSRILESRQSPREVLRRGPLFLRPLKIFQKKSYSSEELLNLAENYAMTIELGGWDLSLLVPRRYFFLHQEMFRMDSGKRDKNYNFCPTAPDTIRLLKSEAEHIFRSYPDIAVYHLWPDLGHEKTWCSCPTCRAFTLEEQNRIAVNAAADALADINPQGRISYYENPPKKGDIAIRPNLFRVQCLPGDLGAEAGGWFLSKIADKKDGSDPD
jgi:hypothetical protein